MPFGNARGQGFNSPAILNFDVDNVVINPKGLFVYSASIPALGNLIASIVFGTANVTDKAGNVALPGQTSYVFQSGTYQALNIYNGQVNWFSAPTMAGPWTEGSGIDGRADVFNVGAGTGGSGMQFLVQQDLFRFLDGLSGMDWTPSTGLVAISGGTDQGWNILALTTVTGSGNGVNGIRCKLLPVNAVLLEWDIATNSVANGVTVATLPANCQPAKAHNIASGTYGGTVALTTAVNPHFTVNTNGTIVTGATGGNAFEMCGTALIGLD